MHWRENDGPSFTDAYVFPSNTMSVCVSASIPLWDDLQPPEFANGRLPIVLPNGPIPSTRTLKAVVGFDISLQTLSQLLQGLAIGVTDTGMAWVFDSNGFVVATSNSSIPLVTSTNSLVRSTAVDNVLFNQSMAYILSWNATNVILAYEFTRYGNVSLFLNHFVDLDGRQWILSCQRPWQQEPNFPVWNLVILIPFNDYFWKPRYANQVALLIIFLAIIPLVACVGAVVGMCCIARPTKALATCMEHIGSVFDVSAQPVRWYSAITEVRQLQQSFATMHRGLTNFGKFAPIELVANLLQRNGEAKLGMIAKQATSFFSDIEGFTSISECVAPSILILVLAEYYNAMSEIVHSQHGTVGDYIGDALFAFWNAPQETPEHAFLACNTALLQQEKLQLLRRQWEERDLPVLRARVGINSGSCLAGLLGSEKWMKFTLIGDC